MVDAPSITYLIEGDETILVDTSYGDPERMSELHYECRREPDETMAGALALHDYEPADIDTVVLTHLHWDHCYNLELFEDAELLVQRRELEYAIAPYNVHAIPYESKAIGRTPPWLEHDLTAIEGEVEISPGVTVFPTPGHTIGHMSVEVQDGDETVVAAADAIPTFENLEGTETSEYIASYSMNTLDWWRSANEIDERADRILPGHEFDIL